MDSGGEGPAPVRARAEATDQAQDHSRPDQHTRRLRAQNRPSSPSGVAQAGQFVAFRQRDGIRGEEGRSRGGDRPTEAARSPSAGPCGTSEGEGGACAEESKGPEEDSSKVACLSQRSPSKVKRLPKTGPSNTPCFSHAGHAAFGC